MFETNDPTPDTREHQPIDSMEGARAVAEKLRARMRHDVMGRDEVIELVLVALFGDGHLLLEDYPGSGKTTLAKALGNAIIDDLPDDEIPDFRRIQFTPDLLPSDVTGVMVFDTDSNTFHFRRGPVFAYVVLVDEINRTSPKVQSALLEAMAEKQVTVDNVSHRLDELFFVIATQNPLDSIGTYPLPLAQLDRFLFMIQVNYPSLDEEREILRRTTGTESALTEKVLSGEELLLIQAAVRSVPVADHVLNYALALTRGTRVRGGTQLDFITQYVNWGAGPRAGQALILAGKARAALAGRDHVSIDDLKAVAHPILRHRIVLNFSASAEGLTADDVIDRLLKEVDPSAHVGAGVPGLAAKG